MQAEPAIRGLIVAIAAYLARFEGRDGVADVLDLIDRWGAGTVSTRQPVHRPDPGHFRSALAQLAAGGEEWLARAIEDAAPFLPWGRYDPYPRDEIGEAFADGNSFATIIGEAGVVEAEDVDLGLFLVGPNILYRDHRHAAPELYAPLTGPHGWRFAPGDPLVWKTAHELVWNEPFQPHATLTGDIPFLAVFGWTRDANEPSRIIPSEDWAALETLQPPRR